MQRSVLSLEKKKLARGVADAAKVRAQCYFSLSRRKPRHGDVHFAEGNFSALRADMWPSSIDRVHVQVVGLDAVCDTVVDSVSQREEVELALESFIAASCMKATTLFKTISVSTSSYMEASLRV